MSKSTVLKMNLTQPLMKEFVLDLNNGNTPDLPKGINIFVGQNGAGKTFVLVMNWLLQTIMNVRLAERLTEDVLQQIISGTFDRPIDGDIEITYPDGSRIKLDIDKGEVDSYLVATTEKTEPRSALFMSKNTRTFDQMTSYYYLRKNMSPEEIVEKGINRLYDVMYLEQLKLAAMQGYSKKALSIYNTWCNGFFKSIGQEVDITEIGFDHEKANFFVVNKGNKEYPMHRGAGEQSIMSMGMGQLVNLSDKI